MVDYSLNCVGHHGESYICAQRDTGITRVVNVRKLPDNSKEESALFNELEVVGQIDHPNVIKLFEVYQDNKNYYIVKELLTGGDLFDHIRNKGTFSEHDAAVIMKQVLSAIVYCHSKKIMHRNIKPHNIIFESKEALAKVKLVDFTLSGMLDSKQKANTSIGTIYYVSPEVLKKSYNEKCDVWSCGVLLYLLLSGSLPFAADDRDDLIALILKGAYTMRGTVWDSVSEEAKDLVRHMLEYSPAARYSAEQAFSHKWIKLYGAEKVDKELTKDILGNLKNFGGKCKLQQAALTYIVTQLTTKSETKDLREVFTSLDKTGKGQLNKEDLVKAYREIYGDLYDEEEIANKIMKNIDIDKSGYINYTEFVMATINMRELLSKERLEATFKMFDKDGSGKISATEIKGVLSGNEQIPKERWNEVIKQVDLNGDKEISLDEFVGIMQKLIMD